MFRSTSYEYDVAKAQVILLKQGAFSEQRYLLVFSLFASQEFEVIGEDLYLMRFRDECMNLVPAAQLHMLHWPKRTIKAYYYWQATSSVRMTRKEQFH